MFKDMTEQEARQDMAEVSAQIQALDALLAAVGDTASPSVSVSNPIPTT